MIYITEFIKRNIITLELRYTTIVEKYNPIFKKFNILITIHCKKKKKFLKEYFSLLQFKFIFNYK